MSSMQELQNSTARAPFFKLTLAFNSRIWPLIYSSNDNPFVSGELTNLFFLLAVG